MIGRQYIHPIVLIFCQIDRLRGGGRGGRHQGKEMLADPSARRAQWEPSRDRRGYLTRFLPPPLPPAGHRHLAGAITRDRLRRCVPRRDRQRVRDSLARYPILPLSLCSSTSSHFILFVQARLIESRDTQAQFEAFQFFFPPLSYFFFADRYLADGVPTLCYSFCSGRV